MDPDSLEQIMIDQELMKDKLPFLADGMNVEVEFYQDKPLGITLAQNVILYIQETDPLIKGATATSSNKPAIMNNGLRVMVPPYLVSGEKIIVKTEDAIFCQKSRVMQNQVVLINDAIREASKFLHRDYFELENLQSSARSLRVFVDKAKTRVTENLQKRLVNIIKLLFSTRQNWNYRL